MILASVMSTNSSREDTDDKKTIHPGGRDYIEMWKSDHVFQNNV
jgi:hypothetical protein